MTTQDTANKVAQLLALLDRAFAGDDWHSLLTNFRTTLHIDWDWVPVGVQRSIHSIVAHVGGCKVMYENYAFGDGALQWDDPQVSGEVLLTDLLAAVRWLT